MTNNTKDVPLQLLLVEDSPTDAILFKASVADVIDVKIDVTHRESLKDAISVCSTGKFDAIVLDLNLPDSAGLETFSNLRDHCSEVPIVILSGSEDRSLVNEALRAGADNYLSKNAADGNRIAIAVLSAIRNRQRGSNNFA